MIIFSNEQISKMNANELASLKALAELYGENKTDSFSAEQKQVQETIKQRINAEKERIATEASYQEELEKRFI